MWQNEMLPNNVTPRADFKTRIQQCDGITGKKSRTSPRYQQWKYFQSAELLVIRVPLEFLM